MCHPLDWYLGPNSVGPRACLWPARPGQPLYVLQKWLLARDWTLVRPLVWSHPLLVEELSLDIVVPIGVRQHLIGDAWRGWMLSQHAAGERRDAECVDEILVNGSWSNIDWRPLVLRRLGLLLPGPLFPRLLFKALRRTRCPVTCCWPGCQELGTWEHIAWTCCHRPRIPIVPPRVLG